MIVLGTVVANAQPRERRGNRGAFMMDTLKVRLSLTPEQVKQIQKFVDENQETMVKARESASGDRDQMRKIMQENRDKLDKNIESVLTDEQKPKYEEIKKERLSRMQQGGPGGRRPQ
jgi:Spy/CpxP family protein refolding chaperone